MSVLIFTPTWIGADGREAMRPECRASIEAQQTIGGHEWLIGLENPEPAPHPSNVLSQYRKARARFLEGDRKGRPYDALVTVEHDMVLPDPGAIARLCETPGDVVYAPYLFRHGMRVLSTCQYINDRNLGMSLSLHPDDLRRARMETIYRVSGVGLGCTLIRRPVLMMIEFRGASEHDHSNAPDLRFAADCLQNGFVANGRFDVPVLHFDEGGWLSPFQTRRYPAMKYIARQTANILINGDSLRVESGKEYDLPDQQAIEFVRGGYLTAVNAPAQPAPIEQAVIEPIENADAPAQKRPKRKTLSLS